MNTPELIAPAGTPEKLRTAFLYGADAVYCAGRQFGLRAFAGNFTYEELADGAAYAHSIGKKIYTAVNIFARNSDFSDIPAYLRFLADIGVDGIMASDPGIIRTARREVPSLPLILSTQANCTNAEAVRFWSEQGCSRIVLARELSLDEIENIRTAADTELEVFIHGALCISYSGRCFISRYLTGRDANRGECTHSCRWEYALVEKERPQDELPVEEDEAYTYFFNSKDLCALEHIPALIDMGIEAFKIEGRMKSVSYTASVTAVYRNAVDTYTRTGNFAVNKSWLRELRSVSSRDFTQGFLRGTDLPEDYDPHNITPEEYIRTEFCGIVSQTDAGTARIEVRNRFSSEDRLEFFMPGMKTEALTAGRIYSEREKGEVESVNPNDVCRIEVPFDVPDGCIVRRLHG